MIIITTREAVFRIIMSTDSAVPRYSYITLFSSYDRWWVIVFLNRNSEENNP